MMDRRTLVIAFGATGMASATAVRSQTSLPVIGWLSHADEQTYSAFVASFRKALEVAGFVEGRTVRTDFRWANYDDKNLKIMADEFVRRRVAVIVASGGDPAIHAAKAATASIPIVFAAGGDPVRSGFVTSFSHPGGNLTGLALFSTELLAKRLELLSELLPSARTLAFLANPANPRAVEEVASMQAAADALKLRLIFLDVRSEADCEAAFAKAVAAGAGGVLVATNPLLNALTQQLVAQAQRHKLPTIYGFRKSAEVGGLLSYNIDLTDAYSRLGQYTARILGSARPADVPVQQPARFELIVNLTTARALGLTIPQSIQLRMTEVIE